MLRSSTTCFAFLVLAACIADDEREIATLTACPSTNLVQDPPQFQWAFHAASPTNPQPYYSGVLEYGQATFTINGQTLTTRAYRQAGGTYTIPGPTIRMSPGNKYVLRFHNTLAYTAASTEHNVFKDPDVTNLHTHGVHVSGETPGDDVTRFFEGQRGGDYVYDIPADHMGGTYWYHAHHHGSTFLQVSSGAFGQMLIADANDGVPANVAAMTERQLLVAYLDPGVAGTGGDTLISGTLSAGWTVNGTVQGNFCAPANEWQHWRVLLADRDATNKTFGVGASCEVALLARDGVWRTTAPLALPTRQLALTGASRADFAVRCTNDSTITINGNTVATILVSGAGNTTVGPYSGGSTGGSWSALRPTYLRDLRTVTPVHGEDIHMGARAIGGMKFDMDVPNLTLASDQVQEWTLAGSNQHPFHLHVYHVQAQDCSGSFEAGEYYDTVSSACAVRFDLNAATSRVYEGRTILHCHILEHEDQGAMGWADVIGGVPPPAFPADAGLVAPYAASYAYGTAAWCNADAMCVDADACDGAETCDLVTGSCVAATAPDCDDADPCTADSCDAVEGCVHTPISCTSPPACSYDAGTGTITVTMNGVAGTLAVSGTSIVLDTTTCGMLTDTDTIVVNGTGALMIRGDYVPGRTAEASGLSEIEFLVNNDDITFDVSLGNDVVTIVPTGADLNTDGDQDVMMSGAQARVEYRGGAGNDTLDASAYTGALVMHGGSGVDHLIGGAGADTLYGDADADTLESNAGDDTLAGGAGNDIERGGVGKDTFLQDAAANGADLIDGGNNADTITYGARAGAVSVTLADGLPNDGEAGEGDTMTAVEHATGGEGNDILVGTIGNNVLRGGGGIDQLTGDAGSDVLYGDAGNDQLAGGAGNDKLYGGTGDDSLGDAGGTDTFTGQAGNDTITGNTDGIAETVSCGNGMDTAEGNAEDTFTSCETLLP